MKITTRWRRGSVVAAAGLGLVLAGCSGSSGGDAGSGDTLTLAVGFTLGGLDPQTASDVSDTLLWHNISQTLVEPVFNDNVPTLSPGLAKSWKQDNATTWTFTLQSGVTFSNGEPFDAEAAKFSIERFLDPKTGAGHSAFVKVTKVEALDDTTIRLTTDGAQPDLLRGLAALAMVPPKLVKNDEASFKRKPVGTGPYEIKSATPDKLTLVENPKYWNKAESKPSAKTVVVDSRSEASSRVAAVNAGEAQLASDIPLELLKQLPKTESVPANENLIVDLNSIGGAFSDTNLRKAVALGTDVSGIRKGLFTDDHSRDAKCQIAPSFTFGFNKSLESYQYDPAAAKKIIDDNGLKGKPIVLISPKGHYPKSDEVVQAVASQWDALGLKVELKLLSADDWLSVAAGKDAGDGTYKHEGFDATMVALNSFSLTAAEPLLSAFGQGPIDAFLHTESPGITPLLKKAQSETDSKAQDADLQKVAALACDAYAYLPVANYDRNWGLAKGTSFSFRPDARIVLDNK